MFGGLQRPAKPELKPRPVPRIIDVTGINIVAHMAPDPCTCYNYKMLQYRQRKKEFQDKKELGSINNIRNDRTAVQYLKHYEKMDKSRGVNDRVNEKMAEYDRQIEIRREKLRKLLYEEERLFVKEVVDTAQKAEELIMKERIQKLKTLKERRIADELEIARQNKLRQYLDRCTEFRPVLINQRLRESKQAQLQQMQENESRKLQEQELERMWHEIAMKEMKKQILREEKEALEKKKTQEELKCIMSTYMKEQEEQIEKRKHVLNEERKRLDKLGEEIALENKAEQELKLRKRSEICRSINSQIKERQEILKQQANNELSIANAFDKLVEQEQEKERLKMKQKIFSGKQDMILYQGYLEELRQQRLAEEAQLEVIVKQSMYEIQKKQNEEKCDFEMARKALLENVLKERAEQIEFQRRQKVEQDEMKKSEAEWCRKTREHNEQLSKEQERQNKLAALKYGDELRKQMEYSKVCENRLKKELEDILVLAKTEDKLYNDIVSQTMEGKIQKMQFSNNMNNYEKQLFHREVNSRVNKKMKEYEDSIDGRRKKLADLMWSEEREQIKEVVDDAQRGQDDMLLKMKIRTEELRARREAERLAVVKEKKLQQYLERCEEFRPIVANRRLIESKEMQLMQMHDNQNRKQTERETEHMWYEVLLKEIQTQTDRERQDDFNLRKRNADDKAVWDMQCKAKELQREDKIREIREDAIKMNTLKEILIREEIADLDAKRRKRDLLYRETMLQIKKNQESLARKVKVEDSYARTNARLVWEEEQREKVSNEKERMKQEMHQYRDYIARLDQERREEEKRLNELVEQELKEIQKKQDAARCKYEKARQALQETVMNERKEQLEYRRQEAEEQLNMKQAENQLIQMAYDQNERIRAEYARRQLLAAKQYEDDLKKQIEYSKLLKEREKEELENKILQGKAEEEEYKNTLMRIMKNDVKISEEHPFRRVLNIAHP